MNVLFIFQYPTGGESSRQNGVIKTSRWCFVLHLLVWITFLFGADIQFFGDDCEPGEIRAAQVCQ